MPVTKQAIKKVRQDKRKTDFNLKVKKAYKRAVHDFRKNPTSKVLSEVFSKLDRAAKTNVIHKNTASRLKSRLSLLVKGSVPSDKKTAVAKKGTPKKKSSTKSASK